MKVIAEQKEGINKRKNPFKRLRKIIRVPYFYVPPCPVCGSERTGRYVKYHNSYDDQYATKTSLKNGELIQFTNKIDQDKQFFCLDCGMEWSEFAETRWLTLEEIDEEKARRATDELLDNLLDNEREEKNAEKKKHGFFAAFRRFIGHV